MKDIVFDTKKTKRLVIEQLEGKTETDPSTTQRRKALPAAIPESLLTTSRQLELLRKVIFGIEISDEERKWASFIEKELKSKVNSYKQQDVKRKIYIPDKLIKVGEVGEKLLNSEGKCVFCSCDVLILYENVRKGNQWTLDRVDNDVGHSDSNTRIACLTCNLSRRRQNYDDFHWTKNLVISKE